MTVVGGLVAALALAATGSTAAILSFESSDAAASAECTPARRANAETLQSTLPFGGIDRHYFLTIPPHYDGHSPVPLIVNLHGFGDNAQSQNAETDMPAIAGARGYVVVAPDGGPLRVPLNLVPGAASASQFQGQPFWNVFEPGIVDFGPPHGQNLGIDASAVGADDVGFISQLIDTVSRRLCIDGNRVYVAGMSNGAGMATTLGCALGNRLSAIVAVSGVNLTGKCVGRSPMSVLAIHGDADTTVPYAGNGLLSYHFGNPSVPERMAQWAQRDRCQAAPSVTHPRPGLAVARWGGCAAGTDLQLWTIAGWPHRWPRARTSTDPGVIDATRVALAFFAQHRRHGG
jgi:polyhydroxybutyrate depolymerase